MRVIEARGIEKSYGGKKVLKAVDLDLDSGQLTVLGGLNGSGKSTIIKILSGDISPDNGEIVFDGKRVELRSIVDARHIGISAVYQEYMLVPDLTIAENIFLGSGKFSISRKKMNQESSRLLKEVGLEYEPSAKVSSLSADDQSLLEFAIAAFSEPRVLLIDDLFSVLNSSYKERLLKMINDVKNRGASVLVATPDPEIMQKADRLFFIENSTVVDLPVPLDRGEILRRIGASNDRSIPPSEGEPLIEIGNVAGTGKDLEIRRGELLHVFCGSSEIIRELTRAITRQDPFSENAVPIFREAKSFFERFGSRGPSSDAEKYFSATLKNSGLVSQVMLKKARSFISTKKLRRSYILNKESVVSVKSFLAGLEEIDGFAGIVSDEDVKLSHLRFEACDLYVFVRPLLGLDPVSIDALVRVLRDISVNSKAALVLTDEMESLSFCTRGMIVCR